MLEHADEAAAEVDQPVQKLRQVLQELRDGMEQTTRHSLMITGKPLA